jgi:hypothetical protein
MYRAAAPVGSLKVISFNYQEEAWRSIGGAADMWGTTWTPAQINAPDFGLSFFVSNEDISFHFYRADAVRLTVYYTL